MKEILTNVTLKEPKEVIREVKLIISLVFPAFDFKPLYQVFYDTTRLFRGQYRGFRSCNTNFHDLRHTLNSFLACTRLIHGYIVKNGEIVEHSAILGMISSLMHDTGFIQESDDTEGTGAKYIGTHSERSIKFIKKYLSAHQYPESDFQFCKNCISCTSPDERIKDVPFNSKEEETIGKIVGVSDLISQMADREYIEKLLFLYYELKEANMLDYESELDLLRRNHAMINTTIQRFSTDFDGLDGNMVYHFAKRWNSEKDYYREEIEKNSEYLTSLLEEHESDYRKYLRRGDIIKKLEQDDYYVKFMNLG